MGIPSVFKSVERQFEQAKIPLDSHSFLYSLPSMTSLTWPENSLYLSCRLAWMVSHKSISFKRRGAMSCPLIALYEQSTYKFVRPSSSCGMVTIKIIPNTELALPLINSVEMVVLHIMYYCNSRFATTKVAILGVKTIDLFHKEFTWKWSLGEKQFCSWPPM